MVFCLDDFEIITLHWTLDARQQVSQKSSNRWPFSSCCVNLAFHYVIRPQIDPHSIIIEIQLELETPKTKCSKRGKFCNQREIMTKISFCTTISKRKQAQHTMLTELALAASKHTEKLTSSSRDWTVGKVEGTRFRAIKMIWMMSIQRSWPLVRTLKDWAMIVL